MSYIVKQEVMDYLQIETDAFVDNSFATWLGAIETFIEKYCGKEFEQVDSSDRYIDGNGKRVLYLKESEELISVSAILILNTDGTTLESLSEGHSNDYLLYPYNTTPKYEIRLTRSSSVGAFYKGNRRVKITGEWGNSASVPDDIKLATIIMVAEIINRGKPSGNVDSASLGDYSVEFKASDTKSIASSSGALKILDQYKVILI